MAARSYVLTSVAGTAKRLSDAFGDGVGVVNAANDLPFRQLIIQASATVSFGATAATAPTASGGVQSTTADGLLLLGPFETGPLKLSDLWVIGAATIRILGILF